MAQRKRIIFVLFVDRFLRVETLVFKFELKERETCTCIKIKAIKQQYKHKLMLQNRNG